MDPERPRRVQQSTVGLPAVELEKLYRSLALRLMRRATWRYRLYEEDAREVVHEVFALAMVKLKEEDNARGWLYRMLDNLAANWMRKEIRRRALLARWWGFEQAAPAQPSSSSGGADEYDGTPGSDSGD